MSSDASEDDWTPAENLAGVLRRELDHMRQAYEAGAEPILLDALEFCYLHDLVLPRWLASAVSNRLEVSFKFPPPPGRGRGQAPIPKLHRNDIHFVRYDLAEELRRYQKGEWLEYQRALNDDGLSAAAKARLTAMGRLNPGQTWDDVYRIASEQLQKTSAQGSPDAIKDSHLLVKRAAKKEPGRFYWLTARTRGRLASKK